MPTMIQRSFAGGEIAPALGARADQVKYQTGLRTCRNFIVQRFGGVTNRPGTQYIAETKTSQAVRLVKFVFNSDQTYVLEFGNLYMRVIRAGAQLESSPGVPYELVTPYATADLRDLQMVQSGDVVTIVHPNYQPRELRRTGHTSWTLVAITTAPSISAPTGVTNSGAAGSAVSWVVTAAKADTYEESLPSSTTSTSTVPTTGTPVTVSWSAVSGAAEYYVYKGKNGVFGYVGTAIGTSFADNDITPDMTDTPPQARSLFTTTSNYPSTVTYFQQRLCFANTDNDPEKVWCSRSGNYKNFSIRSPIQDDDAVTFTMAGRQVNEVRHLVEIGKLVVLTSGAEWTVDGDSDGVLRPTAINLKQQGYNGSSPVAPIVVSNSVLFIQARGSIVRDLRYSLETDGYSGKDLTVFAPHLFDGYSLVAWDYAQIPHSVAWAVRSDGSLLGLTYLREHEVWGWHRHDTGNGDAFEDVICVPEGNEDAVYVVARRTINGATKRYIERMASRQVSNLYTDCKFADSHLTYNGDNATATTLTLTGGTTWAYTETLTLTASASLFTAGDVGNAWVIRVGTDSIRVTVLSYTSATVVSVQASKTVPVSLRGVASASWTKCVDDISGLGHLEGRTVNIFADGDVHPQRTVSGGAITLQRPAGYICIGLPITSEIETLTLENINGETLVSRDKLVNMVTMLVESSRGILAGPDADHLTQYKQRSDQTTDQPIALETGTITVRISNTWDKHGRVMVRQTDPLPLTILAIAPSGMIGG